jgi:chloramphenicol 3-O phosphotransferase
MSRVLYLNGTSSAGKSSIVRALQERLDELDMHIQLDVFMQAVPPHGWDRPDGMVVALLPDHGLRVDFGPLCQPLCFGIPSLAWRAGVRGQSADRR